jgi:hypothetical protein
MSQQYTAEATYDDWDQFYEQFGEEFAEAMQANMAAQAEFVDSWADTLESSTDSERTKEGVQGVMRAYQVWIDAAEEIVEQTAEFAEGEDIDVEEIRDVWLDTANESFKEVMSTRAFAAMTGESIDEALDLQQRADESAQATLHNLGLATEGDIEEVGERLVELERRQHAVERKLDRILEEL